MTARPELAGAMSNTLQYFDTKNFVSMIECPVYLTVGGKDVICPPLTILNLMDKFRTNVELKRYPNAAHNVIGPDYFREKYQWLKPLLDK
jgi:cephalosporin-C deacetylase-like acetyl esterase